MRHAALWFVAACGSGGGFIDAPKVVPVDPGTIAIAWSLTSSSGQPLSCTQAAATTVHLGIVDADTGDRSSESFACSLGAAVSGEVFPANYDLSFDLLGAAGTLATAPPQTAAVTPDHTTQLGAVAFVVPAS